MPLRCLFGLLGGMLALMPAGCGRDTASAGLVVGHVDHARAVLAMHASELLEELDG